MHDHLTYLQVLRESLESLRARIGAVEAQQKEGRTASSALNETNDRLDCEVTSCQLKVDGTQELVESLERRVKELSQKMEKQKESLKYLETKVNYFLRNFDQIYSKFIWSAH